MRLWIFALGIATAACADDMVPVAPPSSVVLQNIAYTTNVYPAERAESQPAATITEQAPPPVVEAPPLPPVVGVRPLDPPPIARDVFKRDTRPVGIAACDAYLARVETCSTRMLNRLPGDHGDAIARIVASLDITRRAWRNADLPPRARAQLAETCADSQRLYDSSASASCVE